MISGKIEMQKYYEIHMVTKNVRNPHIVRTLPILHFFGLFKIFWGVIWLGCCLNRFVTLRRWSNDIRKNQNPKILKISKGMKNVMNFLPILHFFELLKNFGDFI